MITFKKVAKLFSLFLFLAISQGLNQSLFCLKWKRDEKKGKQHSITKARAKIEMFLGS